jgi:hypothetical protein
MQEGVMALDCMMFIQNVLKVHLWVQKLIGFTFRHDTISVSSLANQESGLNALLSLKMVKLC